MQEKTLPNQANNTSNIHSGEVGSTYSPRLSLEGRKEYIEKKPQGLIKIEQNGCEND